MNVSFIKKFAFLICILCLIICTSCNNENSTKNEIMYNEVQNIAEDTLSTTKNNSENETINNTSTTLKTTSNSNENQDVAKQIIAHKEEWIQIDNEYSKKISYDPINASMISLYPTETKGTYEMIVIYPLGTTTYAPIFKVNANSFTYARTITDKDEYKNFAAGSVYSGITALASAGVAGNNADENIYKMCNIAYFEEDKYFTSIELNVEDNITLSGDDKLLYDNLWYAINELEFIEFQNGITSKLEYIEFRDFGQGECKAIFHYVGTWDSYSITSYGYDELTYDDEQILKNSTLKRINWDPVWTTEKKEYNLKYAIFNS